MALKTTYKDDILNTSVNQKRRYTQTTNTDGTVSLTDVTTYSQVGDNFGAKDINDTNAQVNANTDAIATLNSNLNNKIDGKIQKVKGFTTAIGNTAIIDYPEGINYSNCIVIGYEIIYDVTGAYYGTGVVLETIHIDKGIHGLGISVDAPALVNRDIFVYLLRL